VIDLSLKTTTRFAVSLHPEIFHALQVVEDDQSRIHPRWKAKAKKRLPRRWRELAIPAGIWPGLADVLDIPPITRFSGLVSALEAVPLRQVQERLLIGLFHHRKAVTGLLDEGMEPRRVVSSLPSRKREWLAYIGLFPVEPPAETTLELLVRSPEEFLHGAVQALKIFWYAVFAETWRELLPALEASVSEKQRLFETCSLPAFIRHTLLPVECDGKKRVLRAIRGGAEIPMDGITACTFTPSVFNDRRFWTVSPGDPNALWFPYFEPDLGPDANGEHSDYGNPQPDIALIFSALGDATRFAMASLIGRKPRSAAELAVVLSVSKPTISHHVHVLRSAGLIHETEHGGSVLISLRKPVLGRLSELATQRLLESREPLELRTSRKQA
jgi:DNA-binding transcriptional ArsR family regulator